MWKFSANMPKKWTIPNRRIYKYLRVKERDVRECLKTGKRTKSSNNVGGSLNIKRGELSIKPKPMSNLNVDGI